MGQVPLWAKALGALLAVQVATLVAAGAAAGALLSSSVESSRHDARTFAAGPAVELALGGFPHLDCSTVRAAGPPCTASSSGPRRLGVEVRVVPGAAGEIVVEQDVRVRAAGPALAEGYLRQASMQSAAGTGVVRLSLSGWNPRDPRLLDGENRLTLRAPPGTRVLTAETAPAPAGNPPNPPNLPNEPNVPNPPAGRAGVPVTVAPGQRLSGDAQAWQADVKVDGEVGGKVLVVRGTATIDGTVHGDVQVWSGAAVITGQVDGKVSVAGGTLTVAPSARVGGGVRAWRTTAPVALDGAVAGSVQVARGGLTIGPTGTAGNTTTVWQPPAPVSVRGRVRGPLEIVQGAGLQLAEDGRADRGVTVWSPDTPVQVDGRVGGDMGVDGGRVHFGPRASVGGRVLLWRGAQCAGPAC